MQYHNTVNIALINMPFAEVSYPAFGLTQLQTLLNQKYSNVVKTEVLYLNHDFASFLGLQRYRHFYTSDNKTASSGLEVEYTFDTLREWVFKSIAFPEAKDNLPIYFAEKKANQELIEFVTQLREKIPLFFIELIRQYNLEKTEGV